MENISSFLEKTRKFEPPDITVRKKFVEVVNDLLGIDLNVKDIRVINFEIYVKASPAVRSEIFLNKIQILDKLKQELGNKAPVNIK